MIWFKNIFNRWFKHASLDSREAWQYLGNLVYTIQWTDHAGKAIEGHKDYIYYHFHESTFGERKIIIKKTQSYSFIMTNSEDTGIWQTECYPWINNGPTPKGIAQFDPSKISLQMLVKKEKGK